MVDGMNNYFSPRSTRVHGVKLKHFTAKDAKGREVNPFLIFLCVPLRLWFLRFVFLLRGE